MPSLLLTQMPTQVPRQRVRSPLKTFCAPPLTLQERTTKRKGKQNTERRTQGGRWPQGLSTRQLTT